VFGPWVTQEGPLARPPHLPVAAEGPTEQPRDPDTDTRDPDSKEGSGPLARLEDKYSELDLAPIVALVAEVTRALVLSLFALLRSAADDGRSMFDWWKALKVAVPWGWGGLTVCLFCFVFLGAALVSFFPSPLRGVSIGIKKELVSVEA